MFVCSTLEKIMDIKEYMQSVGRQARAASRRLATASTAEKNAALLAIAAAIRREKAALVAANQEDLAAARAAGLEAAMLDRLTLSEKGVDSMAEGVEQVASAAERHRRCGSALPEIRQRRHPARWFGSHPLESCHCRTGAGRPANRRPAG